MAHRFFISAGEPSGDIHAANLLAALRRRMPTLSAVGFGGERLQNAGAQLLYPLVDHPIMGVRGVLRAVPLLRRLLRQVDLTFETDPPSAVVLIDYPGFNWLVARRASQRGIPVIYYVPPQIWAWASHRVRKIQRYVDLVLCSLPFEESWYQSRGVHHAHYVGHPFFDDLDQRPLDTDFVSKAHAAPGSPRLLLLPGSRRAEAEHNASLLCRSAAKLRRLVPGTRVDIAAFNEPIAKIVRRSASQCQLPVDIHVGRARELMSLADAAVSVSGSVSMELLHHAVPTAVVYSVGWFWKSVFLPLALETPYITLVNLLAGRPLFPEYVGPQDFSAEIAKSVAPWLADPARRQAIRGQLLHLKKIYAHPGASDRAALAIEEYLSAGSKKYRKSA